MLDELAIARARVALEELPRAAAFDLVEDVARDRCNVRRRSPRIAPRTQPQCKVCRRFVASTARPCDGCGYLDGAGYVVAA